MNEIVTQPNQPLAQVEPSITSIIASAVQSGRSPEELSQLLAFARQIDADKARKEFAAAMAEFKRTCPKIRRRTENAQYKVTRNGTTKSRTYASLADIEEAIGGPLSAAGLSYGFTDTEVGNGELKIGCIVQHAGGHVADPRFVSFPLESQAGASAQQKRASVIEYCRRYSLKNALGLTDCDDDDDDGNDAQTISDDEARSLNDALIEVAANVEAFRKVFGIERLADMPKSRLAEAYAKIEEKKAKLGVKK
jgi:hypothetical protein